MDGCVVARLYGREGQFLVVHRECFYVKLLTTAVCILMQWRGPVAAVGSGGSLNSSHLNEFISRAIELPRRDCFVAELAVPHFCDA